MSLNFTASKINSEIKDILLFILFYLFYHTAFAQCKSYYQNIGSLSTQGPFGAQTVTFQKSNLPCHDSVYFELLLDVSKSWDGNGNYCCGPDIFQVIADNKVVFQTTFSLTGSFGNRQSYPAQYDKNNLINNAQGTGKVGTGGGGDRYLLKFSFPHTSSDIKIQVAQPASQGVNDEAWYLNKMTVNIKTCKGGELINKNFVICKNEKLIFKNKTYTNTGVYYDTIKSKDCDTFFTINLTVKEKPTGKIIGPSSICQFDTNHKIEFYSSDSSEPYIYTYRLINNTSQTIVGDKNNRANFLVPSDLAKTLIFKLEQVALLNQTSCFSSQNDSIIIIIHPVPKGRISQNQLICQYDTGHFIEFFGYNSTAPYTFTYQINKDLPSNLISKSDGKYLLPIPTNIATIYNYKLLKITDNSPNNCSSLFSDSSTIIINKLPNADIKDNLITCKKDSLVYISFAATGAQSPYTFHYQINSNPITQLLSNASNSAELGFSINNSGKYSINLLKVSDGSQKKCERNINKTITITVNNNPTANFTYSPDIIFQNTAFVYFNNTSTGTGLTYDWQYNNQFFSSNKNPKKSFPDTGLFTIKLNIKDTNNCIDSKEKTIKVNENFNVFIPNVFTPNSNSLNDFFYPVCTGILKIEFIKIYNRWGEILHNSPEKWDGRYKNFLVPEGVYIYEICVRDKRWKKHYYKGSVHVLL